jgi:hypothetical protein
MTIDIHDMDDVQYDNIQTVLYRHGSKVLKDGSRANLLAETEDKHTCCKIITNRTRGTTRCFIRHMDGKLVNPFGADFFKLKLSRCRWLKVTEEVFDMYATFLRTGRRQLLIKAEREI